MNLKVNKKLLCMSVIIAINIGTLCFVAPLKQNLSHLGNALGHKYYLIVWGVSAAAYFYYFTRMLMKKNLYQLTLGKVLLLVACIIMALSVLLPYDPTTYAELSKWHTRLAMWGTILYVAVFYHFLYDLMKKNYSLFTRVMPYYTMLVGFNCLLFTMLGVNTLMEISFTIIMSILLYFMDHCS